MKRDRPFYPINFMAGTCKKSTFSFSSVYAEEPLKCNPLRNNPIRGIVPPTKLSKIISTVLKNKIIIIIIKAFQKYQQCFEKIIKVNDIIGLENLKEPLNFHFLNKNESIDKTKSPHILKPPWHTMSNNEIKTRVFRLSLGMRLLRRSHKFGCHNYEANIEIYCSLVLKSFRHPLNKKQ